MQPCSNAIIASTPPGPAPAALDTADNEKLSIRIAPVFANDITLLFCVAISLKSRPEAKKFRKVHISDLRPVCW